MLEDLSHEVLRLSFFALFQVIQFSLCLVPAVRLGLLVEVSDGLPLQIGLRADAGVPVLL